jgi:hypothetical protein|nr:MAG TPA: hypothetical protein [Caudoviricetes sp.]
MQIVFNVEKEIESRGWSEAWYEGEEVAKDVARSLQHELWRTYPELGGQIVQSTVEADGEKVVIETAHSELEEVARESFEQVLLETLSASYPEYFFDETAGGLADDIVFGENGEVDRWVDDAHERLLELGVTWSGLSADAELVTDTEFQRVVDQVLIELEDTLTDFRVEHRNPLLGVEDLMNEGYYLDLAESVSINGFDCDGEDAKRVQDLIEDLEENPHVDLGSDEIHAAMLKSDESGLVRVARKLEGTGLYDVTEVVQECINEHSKIFRPDLAEEWSDVAKATSEALEQLVSDIEGGDRALDYLYQEAQNTCIYYTDVASIIDAIGLSELDDLVDEPQIAMEALPGEEVSLSMVFTRLAAMALERLTVTYAMETLSALARELKS